MSAVLIVGPSWLGDLIMSQPLVHQLSQDPDIDGIDLLVPAYLKEFAEYLPGIRRAISFPFGHGVFAIKQRYDFALQNLKKDHYQKAIILPNSFKSALVPFFAGIPERIGWLAEMRFGVLTDWRYGPKRYTRLVDRYHALAFAAKEMPPPQTAPAPVLRAPPWQAGIVEKEYDRSGQQKPILILCPGAEFGPSKQWSMSFYAEVAAAYQKKNWTVWILGSPKDRASSQELSAQASQFLTEDQIGEKGSLWNACGQTTLPQALAALDQASLVLSNDSGLMHMAAALGKPVLGLYGSTDPRYTPPLGKAAYVLKKNHSCSPCFKRSCPLTDPLAHHACMRDLSPREVLAMLDQMWEAVLKQEASCAHFVG